VYQIYDLERVVMGELNRVHVPTLIVHAEQDEVAPPSNVAELQKHLHDPAPEILWLNQSHHVVTLDYERDQMNQAILKFFEGAKP
jgi:carboxylesterase